MGPPEPLFELKIPAVFVPGQNPVDRFGLDPKAELKTDSVRNLADSAFAVDEVPGLVRDDPK